MGHHQQHHHGGFNHLPVSQAYNHTLQAHHHQITSQTHFSQLNSFQQHSSILHHPQPLSFGPLLHPTPILATPQMPAQPTNLSNSMKFEQNKLAPSFEFSSLNSNFYKPLNQLQQLSPTNSKSTISIDSSSVSSNSERIVSPHSTVDSHSGINITPPPIIDVTSTSIPAPVATSSSSSTSSITAIQSNGNGISNTDLPTSILSTEPNRPAQNGLLDILMSSDKCQVI